MIRVIVVGSPRTAGRSAHLAEMLFEANIDERPEDELYLVPVSEVDIAPCVACNGCRETMPVTTKDASGAEVTSQKHRCVYDDDMQMVYDLLDEADELTVVAPVFFSGASAQLKALLDRLQPYYWALSDGTRERSGRPATLHVVGEGGDSHGYDALLGEVRSAVGCAGFRLGRVLDWVGKIGEDGEIASDAEVVLEEASAQPGSEVGCGADAGRKGGGRGQRTSGEARGNARNGGHGRSGKPSGGSQRKGAADRPKLDLSAGKKNGKKR